MLKLLLILSLIFLTYNNIYSFAENTDIITYLDQRELSIFYFEADSSDKLEKPQESDEYYQKILTYYNSILTNPNSPKKDKLKALSHITNIKVKQDRFDEAIQLCKDLLYEYPDESFILEMEAEIRLNYANYLHFKGELDTAVKECEAIFNLNLPSEWHAFSKDHIAHLYLSEGDTEQALYYYNRIISDHPNLRHWPASAHYSIAQCYLSQNEKTKAKEHLKTIITMYPDSGWAKPAQDKLRSLK